MIPAKLRYIPGHRVLLCTTCEYCVLGGALDRHLKDIHHLSVAQREKHVVDSRSLDIAELEDVKYPDPGQASFAGLPVSDGYSCGAEGCRHLCVTSKRMQAHWRAEHSCTGGLNKGRGLRCRRVKLQTFFRGKALRYFIVSDEKNPIRYQFPIKKSESAATIRIPSTGPVLKTTPYQSDLEWLLVRHFFEQTYPSLQPCKGSRQSWRDQVLQLCLSVDYLRFAVLSVTANHVAFEQPESRHLYESEANKYRYLAIKSLTSGTVEVNSDNFFAVFNVSRLMTLVYLAGIQSNNFRLISNKKKGNSLLPEWVPIQLNGRELVWHFRGGGRIAGAMHGPYQDLRLADQMPEMDMHRNPYDSALEQLEWELTQLDDTEAACIEALRTLRRVWAVPCRNDYGVGYRDVALMWIVRVPRRYLDLVKKEDPAALVVLAHFCVLWSLAELQYWYMRGHGESILTAVQETLPSCWQHLITWPVCMMGDQWGGNSSTSTSPISTI